MKQNFTNELNNIFIFNPQGGLEYWFWASLGTLFFIMEIFAPGFVFFWFGLGAILVSFLSLIILKTIELQVISWVTLSFLLAFTYFYFNSKLQKKKISTDPIFRYVGYRGEIIQAVEGTKLGRVKLDVHINGLQEWNVISKDPNEKLEIGTRVVVEGIDGIKLIVKKLNS